jgi:hypothetical protein
MTDATPDKVGSVFGELLNLTPQAIEILHEIEPDNAAVNAAESLLPVLAPVIDYIKSGTSSTAGIATVIKAIMANEEQVMAALMKLFPGNPLLAEVQAIFPTLQPILQLLAG